MGYRNKISPSNSNIVLLIKPKRKQTTRNQPKLQTLLKENNETKN